MQHSSRQWQARPENAGCCTKNASDWLAGLVRCTPSTCVLPLLHCFMAELTPRDRRVSKSQGLISLLRQARGWGPPYRQSVAARPYPPQYVSFSRPRTDSRVGR
jgi:hypothetical protein